MVFSSESTSSITSSQCRIWCNWWANVRKNDYASFFQKAFRTGIHWNFVCFPISATIWFRQRFTDRRLGEVVRKIERRDYCPLPSIFSPFILKSLISKDCEKSARLINWSVFHSPQINFSQPLWQLLAQKWQSGN